MRFFSWLSRLSFVSVVTLVVGCGDGSEQPGGDFIADNPHGSSDRGESGTATGAGTSDGGTDSGGEQPGGDDGERDIAEADIIQIEGDRLYALSQYGGLSIIDVSNPDQLPVLGRFRAHAQPFEMYVQDGQVFVMYSQWGHYGWDEETQAWGFTTTSRLMALDATDPADITVRGEFEMPGWIQDSRWIGDIIYLVTYEDGWCWGCQARPNTTVTSLDASDLTDIEIVDQLTFSNGSDEHWGGGPRSVSATDERMYVAGIEWDESSGGHSTIDVIDISDPAGTLLEGASLQVAGQIQSRWQMDEYEGVLRVVSQPGWWGTDGPPRIETFTVASATDIQPLGSLDMTLPRPESLQSVRFDGERGYAITFEQTDPLFTLDLSDPANPQQVGELEIPGFVYHMEPRGDRVLGVGFDRGNPQGSLNVSLFDVSDFANPTMLSRVHFGGDWADVGEDQNRIHKAFRILDELELILVPFYGWEYPEGEEWSCRGTYRSGIQLIDWSDDTLDLQGVAPSTGRARRALIHRDRLLAVSDLSVETFDIANRASPVRTAELAMAVNVTSVAVNGSTVARLSLDWWSDRVALDITSTQLATRPEPLGRLDLTNLAEPHPYECGYYGLYSAKLFAHHGYVYILRNEEDYENWEKRSSFIDVIDARNPAAPVHLQSIELPFWRDEYGWYGLGYGLDASERTIKIGNALVMQVTQPRYSESGEQYLGQDATFQVLDLSDPSQPQLTMPIERPFGLAHGGGLGFADHLVSWHMRQLEDDPSKVRFFLDRIDLSDAGHPQALPSVNVPGAVVAYDPATSRAVTVDFQLQEVEATDETCWSDPKFHDYDYDAQRCFLAHRNLHLVQLSEGSASVLDSHDVEGEDTALRSIVGTPGRLYARLGRGWDTYAEDGLLEVSREELVVFDSWEAGQLHESARVDADGSGYWLGQLHAAGDILLFNADNGLGELDTTDPANPQLSVHDLYGHGCYDLEITGDTALCAMGEWGLQAIDL